MKGFQFSKYIGNSATDSFDYLLKLLQELLLHTNGDFMEAIDWLNELDREYNLTSEDYTMADFIDDLRNKGYLSENNQNNQFSLTDKAKQSIRQAALEEIFGKLKKGTKGDHKSPFAGQGLDQSADIRPFQFGDKAENVNITESVKNINHRIAFGSVIRDEDLVVNDTDLSLQTSTVLMIDISHSMILYGEDRITPAKKVALALTEMIKRKYPKDSIDIITFGNDAQQIELKDLISLQVGPFHTNTVAGLKLARDILQKRKVKNKQIFMITDGKPSCLKEPGGYYKNSFGLDKKIVNKTLNEAKICRKQKIEITTFMIASDPYLQQFVDEFTKANNGKAYYTGLNNLGEFIFHDYANNKRKRL